MFQPGDLVVYKKAKYSEHPGPRAKEVRAAARGDTYSYFVDKFWVVAEVRERGELSVRTRRGKEHVIKADDPHLRHARWWERLFWRNQFPTVADSQWSQPSGRIVRVPVDWDQARLLPLQFSADNVHPSQHVADGHLVVGSSVLEVKAMLERRLLSRFCEHWTERMARRERK